jgi:hypothetical protein
LIALEPNRRGQSRASPVPERRDGMPCKRLIRDSAGLAALASVNRMAREPSGVAGPESWNERSRAEVLSRSRATGPIACLVRTAAAPRCAVQEVDPRFSRTCSARTGEPDSPQAIWEWTTELLRPIRTRNGERRCARHTRRDRPRPAAQPEGEEDPAPPPARRFDSEVELSEVSIWTQLFEELSMSQRAWKKLSSNKGLKDARS